MALWGNNDNVTSAGIVTCDYTTTDSAGNVIVTGHLTDFGAVGSAKTGDVIRFGLRDPLDANAVYMGDAVIVSIAGTQQLSIASTHGLSGVAIAGTDFSISELPVYTVEDAKYSEGAHGTEDSYVYGISTAGGAAAQNTSYAISHAGYVGVLTYMDNHGNLRVKAETLVALSGIQTGNAPIYDGNPLV